MGTLFLSGGGDERQSWDIDALFVKSLRKKMVLYIPIALERDRIGFEQAYDWLLGCLTSHTDEFVQIDMILNLKDLHIINLFHYDALYIGGGNTYKLLYEITTNNVAEVIKHFYYQGGTIYGGSAGAIILGKDISLVSEEREANPQRYVFCEGLNLVKNISFLCHFNPHDSQIKRKINKFISIKHSPVIALEEGSGIVVNNDMIEHIGKGVYEFN